MPRRNALTIRTYMTVDVARRLLYLASRTVKETARTEKENCFIMTNSANPTIDQTPESSDKIDRLAAQIEKLTSHLQAFAGGVVSALSGQPQTAVTPTGKRRGRPPGSGAKQRAASQGAPTTLEKPPHPLMLQAVDLVQRNGRMTQTHLAEIMKIERSHLAHHMRDALSKGLVVKRSVAPKGMKEEVVFYKPEWARFKEG